MTNFLKDDYSLKSLEVMVLVEFVAVAAIVLLVHDSVANSIADSVTVADSVSVADSVTVVDHSDSVADSKFVLVDVANDLSSIQFRRHH